MCQRKAEEQAHAEAVDLGYKSTRAQHEISEEKAIKRKKEKEIGNV